MKNKILVLLLSIFMVLPAYAQLDRSIRPKAGPAPEIKIGDYQSFELPNGLKVYVVENKKLPKVSINLVFERDPAMEKEVSGLSDAVGDMLKRGTVKRSKEKLDNEIDYIGATLVASANDVYASGLSKYSEKMMELTSDVIMNPAFKNEELEKVKKETISGILSTKDSPSGIAAVIKNKIIFGAEHPYGELTSEASVKNITVEKCKEFYSNSFAPNIAYMAIVGDITKAQAEKLVKKYFSKWQKKEIQKFQYAQPKNPLVNRISIIDRPSAVQSVVHVSYPVDLKVSSEDAIGASVLNSILGASFSSRLFMNLREKHGFTYGAYSSLSDDQLAGDFDAYCEVRNSATDSAATEILREMERLVNEKVSTEELQSVKNFITGNFAMSLENPQTVARFALNIARYNLPKDYYQTYLQKLNALTPDDIQALAKKYMKPSRAHVIICGNGSEIGDKMKKMSPSGKLYFYDTDGNEFDPSAKKIPAGLTAKAVMDKYIEAMGGKDNMLKVKDLKMEQEGEIQGMKIKSFTYKKAPNKLYTEFEVMGMKQVIVFDGAKGKMSAAGQEMPLEGDMLESIKTQADMYSALSTDNNGNKYEIKGMEKVDGKDAYMVTTTSGDKVKATNYYDVESGLVVKTVAHVDTPQGKQTVTSSFSDYRDVEGVKYPFSMNIQQGPMPITLKTIKIEINKGIDDSQFIVK